jgi:thiol-disulfide isomerase/thioredoxin
MRNQVVRMVAVAALALCLTECGCAPEARRAPGAPDSLTATLPDTATMDTAAVQMAPIEVSALLDTIRATGGGVVLVNVWASWCQPCREEFPDLLRLQERYRGRGLRLMLVSADFDDQVGAARRFLADERVRFRTYLKTGDDMQFINTLSREWTGALPASFVFDRAGHLYDFWEGRYPYEEIERRVLRVLEASNRPT